MYVTRFLCMKAFSDFPFLSPRCCRYPLLGLDTKGSKDVSLTINVPAIYMHTSGRRFRIRGA